MTNTNLKAIDLSSGGAIEQSSALTNGLGDLEHAVTNPPAWLQQALSVPREEGFVNVDGCDIHYFRWGDPSKPAIVMLHGFIAHARCFAFIAPYLADDYHVVAYDFSGMGDSGSRGSYSEDVRTSELLGVTQQLGLFDGGAKPTIIAHSYGGHVGVAALHAHADKFAGIVICDLMILRPSVIEGNAEKFKPPGNLNANKPNRVYPDYETAKQRFVLSPVQQVEHEELFDFMAYHSLKQVDGGWSWKFHPSVFAGQENMEERWASVGKRVVETPGRKAIVYGKESRLFSDDSVVYVNELIDANDSLAIPIIGIPHARHHLMLDQPIAFVSSLKMVLALWAAASDECS